jgi:FAD/FMN-containing dehydrogenase
VEFAQTHGLEVAVRGGGHDVLGKSVCEGGMVIDLSSMKRMETDPFKRLVRAQAGLRSGELNAATHPSGLAVPLGCNPVVGIAGLTLGGGVGWLAGTCGATCDNLIAAEIVTADARTVWATTEQHPELFWGLHGGGGNFGIVTELVYRLAPVDRVLGGLIVYRVAQLAEFLRFYRDFMAAAPDELTVELSIVPLSQPVVFAMVCYSGAPEVGERVVKPLRSFGPPVADGLRVLPYPELAERPPMSFLWRLLGMSGFITMAARQIRGKPEANIWKGGCLSSLSDAAIELLTRCIVDAPPSWSLGLGHYMHGALCRVSDTATPMLRKQESLTYFFSADWRDPSEAKATMAWVERSWTAMQPVSDRGTYINYLSVESEEAVRESYGAHYGRLLTVKQQYDPTNFFHLNRNIPPHV